MFPIVRLIQPILEQQIRLTLLAARVVQAEETRKEVAAVVRRVVEV
jgi:hypothetical protein